MGRSFEALDVAMPDPVHHSHAVLESAPSVSSKEVGSLELGSVSEAAGTMSEVRRNRETLFKEATAEFQKTNTVSDETLTKLLSSTIGDDFFLTEFEDSFKDRETRCAFDDTEMVDAGTSLSTTEMTSKDDPIPKEELQSEPIEGSHPKFLPDFDGTRDPRRGKDFDDKAFVNGVNKEEKKEERNQESGAGGETFENDTFCEASIQYGSRPAKPDTIFFSVLSEMSVDETGSVNAARVEAESLETEPDLTAWRFRTRAGIKRAARELANRKAKKMKTE